MKAGSLEQTLARLSLVGVTNLCPSLCLTGGGGGLPLDDFFFFVLVRFADEGLLVGLEVGLGVGLGLFVSSLSGCLRRLRPLPFRAVLVPLNTVTDKTVREPRRFGEEDNSESNSQESTGEPERNGRKSHSRMCHIFMACQPPLYRKKIHGEGRRKSWCKP